MVTLIADGKSDRMTIDAVADDWSGGGQALLSALRRLAAVSATPVYLVGGPVRDWLLGRPGQDLDFAVEGDATGLARSLAAELNGRAVIHSRFGTATVITDTTDIAGGRRVDLVMARREVYPRPGGLPQVFPGTIYDDLARRDFSVNAMALPLAGTERQLLAPAGVVEDLNRGVIRVLHTDSFVDDPTRLLRAARYEQRLGFALEGDTEGRLRDAVAQDCLNTVSGDRLRGELARMFEETQPGPPLLRAAELGILPAVHPDWGRVEYLQRWAERGPEIIWETGLSSNFEELTWLAALAYPLSENAGEGLINRLNMPKTWAAVVRDSIGLRRQEGIIADPDLPPSRLCGLLEGVNLAVVAAGAGLTDSPVVSRALRCYLVELRYIKPALRGDDLMAMGVPPGPAVGKALVELRVARQDGRVGDTAGERRWVGEWLAANDFME